MPRTSSHENLILQNDFRAQWTTIQEPVLRAVERVGRSGWLILGRELSAFEGALTRAWGVAHAVGCGNGLDAITIALIGAGLVREDLVLTTPLSAFATTLAIVRAGGVPVFADVDAHGLLDLELARDVLRRRPEIRTMVPVHLYGHALPLARLAELKQEFGLRLVEDCAQAIAATSEGVPVGTVGQAAAVSFYPTKNLGALGDGGAVLTDDPAVATRARSLRDYGQTAKYEHAELGLNSRLDELQAAVLSDAMLPRLMEWTARRRALAARYLAEIRHPALTLPGAPAGSASVWHLFPALCRGDRDGFLRHLAGRGIATGRHYPRLIPDQPALRGCPHEVLTPLTQAGRYAAQEVSLPVHPFLTDEEAGRVIAACNAWEG